MTQKKGTYVTIQQIDGMSGIKSPHAREIEEFGKSKVILFGNNKYMRVKITVEEKLLGKVENIGFNENYTVTFEFFPEVRAHVLFFNYEEDEALGGNELKFLFSGERVQWVPSEDLTSLLEASLDYLEALLELDPAVYEVPSKKSDLLQMSIQQRTEPFIHLKREHLLDLANFIGGKMDQKENNWTLVKSFYNGISVIIEYNTADKSLNLNFEGEQVRKINNYVKDQLGIFLLNHCLRFISITYPGIAMPKIVKQTFSFSYIKSHFNE